MEFLIPITVLLLDKQKSFLPWVIWELQFRKLFTNLLHPAPSTYCPMKIISKILFIIKWPFYFHVTIYKHKLRCQLYKRISAKNYHLSKSIKRLCHFEIYYLLSILSQNTMGDMHKAFVAYGVGNLYDKRRHYLLREKVGRALTCKQKCQGPFWLLVWV